MKILKKIPNIPNFQKSTCHINNKTIKHKFGFDKIWCLTCCDKNRINSSEREFERLGMDVEYYYNPMNPIIKLCPRYPFDYDISIRRCLNPNANVENLYNGVCACFVGHYNIIKSSYLLGYKKVLIIEDDTLISEKVNIKDLFGSLPKDFDVVQLQNLNGNNYDGGGFYYELLDNTKDVRTTGMYAISRDFMQFYLDLYDNINPEPSDYFYDHIDTEQIKCYRLKHNIHIGYNSASIIDNGTVVGL